MAFAIEWASTSPSSLPDQRPQRVPIAELEALFAQWQACDKDGKGALMATLPLCIARELVDVIMANTQAPVTVPRKTRI